MEGSHVMNNKTHRSSGLLLKSCTMFYLYLMIRYILLWVIGFCIDGMGFFQFFGIEMFSLWFGCGCLSYFLFCVCRQSMISAVIGSKGIRYNHDIVPISRDFIELFRVVDYGELQSIAGSILGYKTIVIYSNDRTNPVVKIRGVKASLAVHDVLMMMVRQERINNHVYVSGN